MTDRQKYIKGFLKSSTDVFSQPETSSKSNQSTYTEHSFSNPAHEHNTQHDTQNTINRNLQEASLKRDRSPNIEYHSLASLQYENEQSHGTRPTYHETLLAQDWDLIAQQQINNKDGKVKETSIGSLTTNFENLSTDTTSPKQHSKTTYSIAQSRQESIENAAPKHDLHRHSAAGSRPKTNHTLDTKSRNILVTESSELISHSDSDADLDDLFSDQRLAFLLHELEDAKKNEDHGRRERLLQKLLTERLQSRDQIKYSLELAEVYALNSKWAEAYSVANSLSISRDDTNNLVTKRYIEAEAALELGDSGATEDICAKTIKLLRKKNGTQELQHDFMYLLSEVARKKCDQEQLRFYTFNLPNDYIPRCWKDRRSEIPSAELIKACTELCQRHNLTITYNKVHGQLKNKYNAVLEASIAKKYDVMTFLLNDDPKLIGHQDGSNYPKTLLHIAGVHGLIDLAKCLLSRGADINAGNRDQETALHWAAYYGHEAFVQFLLQNGARKDLKNRSSYTPRQYAKGAGHNAVARLL